MSFEAAWSEFRAAPCTLGPSPGVREAWHRGRARYAVWGLRIHAPAVHARMADAAERLRGHGVVPFGEPHVTAFVAGFPTHAPREDDDVAWEVLEAQERALRAAVRPLRLLVHGLNAFLSCPILEVTDPDGTLAALRAALAGLHPELRFAPYRPHLTLGLFSDTRPTGPVAAAIAPARVLPPLAVHPDAIELLSYSAREAGGPLRTERTVPLPAAPGLPPGAVVG